MTNREFWFAVEYHEKANKRIADIRERLVEMSEDDPVRQDFEFVLREIERRDVILDQTREAAMMVEGWQRSELKDALEDFGWV